MTTPAQAEGLAPVRRATEGLSTYEPRIWDEEPPGLADEADEAMTRLCDEAAPEEGA